MFPLNPLSLLCAILLCLPLAAIFTFTTPSSPTAATSAAATTSLPIIASLPKLITKYPDTILSPPRKTLVEPPIKNQTAATPPAAAAAISIEDEADDQSLFKIEDEADDQSLFKRASRVDPTPKPAKKVAFMFLTTTSLPHAPLWELFFSRAASSTYNIYVHADPRVNHTAAFRGVFARRVIPSKPTRRHSPTLTSAARRLLAHALLHDPSNSMFALLSPTCVPIHSFRYTYRYLTRSRRSFVEILDKEPGAYGRWAARGDHAMEPEVRYNDFRIGSQFWVMKRKHARIIMRDRKIWSKFKLPCLNTDTCYPEEQYFPTLLSMVDPRGCTPCTLTHVDWKIGASAGHPRMYGPDEVGPELIWALRKARPRYGDERSDGWNSSVIVRKRRDPFLFARKFSSGSLHQLMNIAREVIFKD